MNILKIEPFSGVSGDMFLGALAELAEGWDELVSLPQKLGLKNVEVKISNVEKSGIACKHIKIIDNNEYFPINQQSSLLHHDHSHSHNHRHLSDIYRIIDNGDLTDGTKQIAKEIFLFLGQAEAKVHGVDINKIHFHEVGAIDSIMDIVGSAFLLDKLQIQKSYSFDVCTGFGFADTEHGKLPVPCPATKELLIGFPTYIGKINQELTTPTGAAILKYLNPEFKIPSLTENKIGYGPGERNFIQPNVLRLSLCKLPSEQEHKIFMLETNIDDISSEIVGVDFQNQLFEKGALDFYFTQILMKKGRPGLLVTVFAEQNNISRIADYLLENTTSIGLRYFPVERKVLDRKVIEFQTSIGLVKVKEIITPSGKKRYTPEYESCLAISKEKQLPINQVFNLINSELYKLEDHTSNF